jgi:RES domain-containing protein
MVLWRIAAETRLYRADDLTGAGAAANPGRWNEAGQPALYAAPSVALAVLETAAHIDDGGLPLNRYLVRLDVPASIWRKRAELDPATLPPAWEGIPAGAASAQAGARWLKSRGAAILLTPSVIVPEEHTALINALHPDATRIKAAIVRPFEYNRLFRHG